MRHTR
ncbi:hypothetical protein VCHC06A1_0007, partial [Vibrio cholerae HC-06A1]|jgi:hypothetical protein